MNTVDKPRYRFGAVCYTCSPTVTEAALNGKVFSIERNRNDWIYGHRALKGHEAHPVELTQ